MKILLLTRYAALGASSRVRFLQYVPYLQAAGFSITTQPLFDDRYLQTLYEKQTRSSLRVIKHYLHRVLTLCKAKQFDCLWIEKELFPWLPAFAEKLLQHLKIPYIVDYDDAIFHNYDLHGKKIIRQVLGKKIDHVMQHSSLVVAGNDYLAERAATAGAKHVTVIPTIIDLNRYEVIENSSVKGIFTIGWIGNPATSPYLQLIQKPLAQFCQQYSAQLVIIGAPQVQLAGVNIIHKSWSEITEVAEIQQFDVGIMPLHATPWENGKCGYKLIQYMACAKPVIASPIGVNQQLVEDGHNGFLAASDDAWFSALTKLYHQKKLALEMGLNGRKKIENEYCLQVTAPKLKQCFDLILEAK